MAGTVVTSLAEAVAQTEARILIIDIERRPMMSYHWSPKVQYIPARMNIDRGGMISYAAKWYGHPDVEFKSVHHDGKDDMLESVWRVLDEADVVVGFNSQGFDLPHIVGELALAGFCEPSPYKQADLMKAAKRKFNLPYNSLAAICEDFGLDAKLANSGFDLWIGCLEGDEECWAEMREYNIQDTLITEQLFDRLRGFLPATFNLNMYRSARLSGCGRCGNDVLEDAGFAYTPTRAYKQFWCEVCGGYSRATHSEPDMSQYRKPS